MVIDKAEQRTLENSYCCDTCNTHYNKLSDLLHHIENHYGEGSRICEKVYSCVVCHKYSELQNHKAFHTSNDNKADTDEDKNVSSTSEVEVNTKSHTDVILYVNEKGGVKQTNKMSEIEAQVNDIDKCNTMVHKKTLNHKPGDTGRKVRACYRCDRMFIDTNLFKTHICGIKPVTVGDKDVTSVPPKTQKDTSSLFDHQEKINKNEKIKNEESCVQTQHLKRQTSSTTASINKCEINETDKSVKCESTVQEFVPNQTEVVDTNKCNEAILQKTLTHKYSDMAKKVHKCNKYEKIITDTDHFKTHTNDRNSSDIGAKDNLQCSEDDLSTPNAEILIGSELDDTYKCDTMAPKETLNHKPGDTGRKVRNCYRCNRKFTDMNLFKTHICGIKSVAVEDKEATSVPPLTQKDTSTLPDHEEKIINEELCIQTPHLKSKTSSTIAAMNTCEINELDKSGKCESTVQEFVPNQTEGNDTTRCNETIPKETLNHKCSDATDTDHLKSCKQSSDTGDKAIIQQSGEALSLITSTNGTENNTCMEVSFDSALSILDNSTKKEFLNSSAKTDEAHVPDLTRLNKNDKSNVTIPKETVRQTLTTPKETITHTLSTAKETATPTLTTPKETVTRSLITSKETVTRTLTTSKETVTPTLTTPKEIVTQSHSTSKETETQTLTSSKEIVTQTLTTPKEIVTQSHSTSKEAVSQTPGDKGRKIRTCYRCKGNFTDVNSFKTHICNIKPADTAVKDITQPQGSAPVLSSRTEKTACDELSAGSQTSDLTIDTGQCKVTEHGKSKTLRSAVETCEPGCTKVNDTDKSDVTVPNKTQAEKFSDAGKKVRTCFRCGRKFEDINHFKTHVCDIKRVDIAVKDTCKSQSASSTSTDITEKNKHEESGDKSFPLESQASVQTVDIGNNKCEEKSAKICDLKSPTSIQEVGISYGDVKQESSLSEERITSTEVNKAGKFDVFPIKTLTSSSTERNVVSCYKCDRKFKNMTRFKRHVCSNPSEDNQDKVSMQQSHLTPYMLNNITKKRPRQESCATFSHFSHPTSASTVDIDNCQSAGEGLKVEDGKNPLFTDENGNDKCGATFPKKARFESHEQTDPEVKSHSCLVCNKVFSTVSLLNSHLLIHTGEKRFSCDLCDKQYILESHLRIHKLLHS